MKHSELPVEDNQEGKPLIHNNLPFKNDMQLSLIVKARELAIFIVSDLRRLLQRI